MHNAPLPDPQPLQVQTDEPRVVALTEARVLQALTAGKIEEQGLLPYSSNHSFLITVQDDDLELPAVYKPQRGESPLWDFEEGTLCRRETAAYVVSQALGWQLVPPTVLREGPRGLGSIQFFVAHDADEHYFTVRSDARFAETLRKLVLFDYIVNNADRKSGHCLIGDDGRMWAIDHGVCFHAAGKLRTVIWEFGGQPIDPALRTDLERLCNTLTAPTAALTLSLADLLSREERAALAQRTEQLLIRASFPAPSVHRRNFPWPPI
ncbi:MAG: SCO1664 family protein [Caldilineaceae bacterium]|nr:SCO1664 family protein [Caldilineaceae bacterium]